MSSLNGLITRHQVQDVSTFILTRLSQSSDEFRANINLLRLCVSILLYLTSLV